MPRICYSKKHQKDAAAEKNHLRQRRLFAG